MDYRNRKEMQNGNGYRDLFFSPYPKSKLHAGNLQMLANKGMKVQIYKCIKLCNPVIQ